MAASTVTDTKLYGRELKLVIGSPNDPTLDVSVAFSTKNSTGLDVKGFDVEFEVEKTLKPEPNTCSIKILNLAESSRKKLSGAKKLTVSLSAGYQDGTSLIYLGEARAAWTERQGPDFVTHIESGDKEKELASGRLNIPQGGKVPVDVALKNIVDALKVGTGNVAKVATTLAAKGIASLNGSALTGHAASRMTDFCRSAGLEWSVQNGNIQILDVGTPLTKAQAILLSTKNGNTGLIDSPSVDSKGIVSAKTLIIPGLVPGVLVAFDTLFVNGGYRVERCRYNGSIFGQEWEIGFSAKKY